MTLSLRKIFLLATLPVLFSTTSLRAQTTNNNNGQRTEQTKHAWDNDERYQNEKARIESDYQAAVTSAKNNHEARLRTAEESRTRQLKDAETNARNRGLNATKNLDFFEGERNRNDRRNRETQIQSDYNMSVANSKATYDNELVNADRDRNNRIANLDNEYYNRPEYKTKTVTTRQEQQQNNDATKRMSDQRQQTLERMYQKYLQKCEQDGKVPMEADEYIQSLQKAQNKAPRP